MHPKITATPLAKARRIAAQGPKSMLRRLDPESIMLTLRLFPTFVPVDGFFEWEGDQGPPYAIAMKDGAPFGILRRRYRLACRATRCVVL